MDNIISNKHDIRETKTIKLRDDAENIIINILDKDTHINYTSESHTNKYIIEVVPGHWDIQNRIGNLLTLKEQ